MLEFQKQTVVAQSTLESELIALSEAIKQCVWLRHLLHSLSCSHLYEQKGTVLYEDNKGAIELAKPEESHHNKTKHIAVLFFTVKDAQENGDINVRYLETRGMLADILTKPQTAETQLRLLDLMKARSDIKVLGEVQHQAKLVFHHEC